MNDLENASITTNKIVQLLEEQLAYLKQQNGDLAKQNNDLLKQIEALTEQIRQLTKALYVYFWKNKEAKNVALVHFCKR